MRRSFRRPSAVSIPVVVASTAQQIIGRPAPGLGDGVLTAEVGSSLPSAAVCAAIGISLAFLVASRRHISGMAVLLAGAGVSLAEALSALLTSSAYVLDVVLSLPVAWAARWHIRLHQWQYPEQNFL